jgi:hypothetical protein
MGELKEDGKGKLVQAVAPSDCITIAADTEISKDILAVAPVTGGTIYFTPNPSNTVAIDAKEVIAVHSNLRFSAPTKCIIY